MSPACHAEDIGDDIKSAVSFMQDLGDKVIDSIKNHKGKEKRKALKKVFKQNVHHKSIAQFVLGKTRGKLRSALRKVKDPAEKKDLKDRIKDSLKKFYDTYKKSIVRIYLSAFERDFKEEVFKASHGKKSGSDGATVYSTLDRKNGSPPVSLHWVLKKVCAQEHAQCQKDYDECKDAADVCKAAFDKCKKDSPACKEEDKKWTVVDLRVENVSQAGKEREEAVSIISKHEGKCKEDEGHHCAVVALEKLTQDHKDLNKTWKEKGKEKSSTASKPASKEAA